jgi:hypothetical protein
MERGNLLHIPVSAIAPGRVSSDPTASGAV